MERSLAAWKMTQDLKAAGGAAESQEPQGNLTSAIPDQPAHRDRATGPGTPPHQSWAGTLSRPVCSSRPMGEPTEPGEGWGLPKATGDFVAEGGPESHLLTSNPDQTPSPGAPGLPKLVYSSSFISFHDLFPLCHP